MRYFYGSLLLLIGTLLEIVFYFFKFNSDGIDIPLSWTMSIGLAILLTGAFHFRKERRALWVLIFFLFIYSVTATSSGQNSYLIENENNKTKESTEQVSLNIEIKEITENISTLKMRLQDIQNAENETVSSLEDIYEWKNTFSKVQEIKENLTSQISEKESRLKDIRSKLKAYNPEDLQNSNTYFYYNKLFGIPVIWLQYFLQTLASAFIAIMAPLGVEMLTFNSSPKNEDVSNVSVWVQIMWRGIRANRGNNLISEDIFNSYVKNTGRYFPKDKFDKIKKAAEKSGVIEGQKIIETDEARAASLIIKKL